MGEEGRKVWTSMQIISLFLCVPKRNQFHNLCIEESCSIQPSKREFNEATFLMKTLLSSDWKLECIFQMDKLSKVNFGRKILISVELLSSFLLQTLGYFKYILCFSLWLKSDSVKEEFVNSSFVFLACQFWFRIYEIISNSDKIWFLPLITFDQNWISYWILTENPKKSKLPNFFLTVL